MKVLERIIFVTITILYFFSFFSFYRVLLDYSLVLIYYYKYLKENFISYYYEVVIIWLIFSFLFSYTVLVVWYFIVVEWPVEGKKPIKYDLDDLVADYPFLSLCDFLSEVQNNEITTAPEKELVPSRYVSYRTEEICLPFVCKQMLDEMIGRTFQVCNKIEIKDVSVGICAVLNNHLKEYKKALKRYETTPDSSIETLYKKTHSYKYRNSNTKVDHCTKVVRFILKELVPSHLWNTPCSKLLLRILSKKLDMFIENTITDPIWLNDRLLTILKENEDTKDDKEEQTKNLTVENHENTDELKPKASPFNKNEGIVKVKEIKVEIEPAAILSQKLGRQDRNEVKIYDRIIQVIAESLICSFLKFRLEDQSKWVKEQIFAYIKQLSMLAAANVDKKLCKFDIDRTCQIVLDKLPETYLYSQVSEEALSQAVKLILSSFSHREVNKEVMLNTIDVFAVHIQKCAHLLKLYYYN